MTSDTPRKICFVTGTRAEFGLMQSTLRAIGSHPRLRLQLVVTGMHLDRAHGRSIETIRKEGWRIDATVPWPRCADAMGNAVATGAATAGLAKAFAKLEPDVVMVVGDRVEAFAAAAAAHVARIPLAHVHGGDRALGQVDDALRHAITKLSHIHFPATKASAARIIQLGEDRWRVHTVGSPGIDGIETAAAGFEEIARVFPHLARRRFALLVLHPTTADERAEQRRTQLVLKTTVRTGFDHVVVVYPNNDPGAAGILRAWDSIKPAVEITVRRDLPRPLFLGLMRDAAVLVGNSSSGIIEAASFGTPVVDIGPRQLGRERGGNVFHVDFDEKQIAAALAKVWNDGSPRRSKSRNVYGGGNVGARIANTLAKVNLDTRLLRKLITY